MQSTTLSYTLHFYRAERRISPDEWRALNIQQQKHLETLVGPDHQYWCATSREEIYDWFDEHSMIRPMVRDIEAILQESQQHPQHSGDNGDRIRRRAHFGSHIYRYDLETHMLHVWVWLSVDKYGPFTLEHLVGLLQGVSGIDFTTTLLDFERLKLILLTHELGMHLIRPSTRVHPIV